MSPWGGGVRSRLILPILATVLVLGAYIYAIWLPDELRREEQDHLTLINRHLESVAEGLFPLMVSEQLDSIHENLAVLEEQNPNWVSIRLTNQEGRQLYPLMLGTGVPPVAASAELRMIRIPIESQNVRLGELEVQVDLGPTMDDVRDRYTRLALMLGILSLLLVFGITVTVEGTVARPLRELAEAARKLAKQEFDTPLPPASRDEVGSLVHSFSAMREDMRIYQSSLEKEVTEHQRAEAALQELNATLESRVHEEVEKNRRKDHLIIQQSRSVAMGELAHNIAHHWRQPLNKIALLTSNLGDEYADGALSPERLRYYQDKLQNVVQELSGTIDDFRDFFAPDETARPFDVTQAVKGAIVMVEAGFHDVRVELTSDLAEQLTSHGFPHEFSQAVLNLLNNAREAIQARHIVPGHVHLSLTHEDGCNVLRISDNGGGFPSDVEPRLFDPYFSTKPTGGGIGLYMVKKVVESMQGSVQAANVGQGAEFTLRLPAHPGPAA